MSEETILKIIMGIGTGLSGAVAYLFTVVMKQSSKQEEMSRKIGHLEGKQDGIEEMSKRVLNTVHTSIIYKDSIQNAIDKKLEEVGATIVD